MKEVFKKTGEILKSNIAIILAVILLIVVPLWAIQFFVVEKVCDIENSINTYVTYIASDEALTVEDATELPADVRSAWKKILTYYGLSALLSVFSLLAECIAMVLAVKRIKQKNEVYTLMPVMNDGMTAYPRVILATVIVLAICLVGFTMFILPGIYLTIVLSCVVPAVIYTKSIKRGLFESLKLFRKMPGKLVLLTLIYRGAPLLLSFILSFALSYLTEPSAVKLIASLIGTIITGLASVICAMFCEVFYLENTEYEPEKEDKVRIM